MLRRLRSGSARHSPGATVGGGSRDSRNPQRDRVTREYARLGPCGYVARRWAGCPGLRPWSACRQRVSFGAGARVRSARSRPPGCSWCQRRRPVPAVVAVRAVSPARPALALSSGLRASGGAGGGGVVWRWRRSRAGGLPVPFRGCAGSGPWRLRLAPGVVVVFQRLAGPRPLRFLRAGSGFGRGAVPVSFGRSAGPGRRRPVQRSGRAVFCWWPAGPGRWWFRSGARGGGRLPRGCRSPGGGGFRGPGFGSAGGGVGSVRAVCRSRAAVACSVPGGAVVPAGPGAGPGRWWPVRAARGAVSFRGGAGAGCRWFRSGAPGRSLLALVPVPGAGLLLVCNYGSIFLPKMLKLACCSTTWVVKMVASPSPSSRGFQSGGRAFGGAVVVRVSKSGWVWAFRAARSASGSFPSPACVYVPFCNYYLARSWCRELAACGWRAWVRRSRRCASPFEVKIALPPGLSASAARARFPSRPSALAELGV